ncbi:VOC family protein [Streptomyces sp. NPDC007002]|uniref:VOC family protein n=1 Tax=Streptomyces sp. NPDC007002 TaxID=3156910 RepID=UPI0034539E2E
MGAELTDARAFYGEVLGWSFQCGLYDGRTLVALADGDPVAGIRGGGPRAAPAQVWTPYFAVRDADETAARIRERGGTVAVGPMAMGEGRVGLAADRDGAAFGFWEGCTLAWPQGADKAPARLDLQTSDMFDSAVFYGEVLDWATTEGIDVTYRDDHVLVMLDDRVILSMRGGGARTSPLDCLRPGWLVHFAVDDVERAVSAAMCAGGSRPRHPLPRAPKGFSRTLLDPGGGQFSLTHRED